MEVDKTTLVSSYVEPLLVSMLRYANPEPDQFRYRVQLGVGLGLRTHYVNGKVNTEDEFNLDHVHCRVVVVPYLHYGCGTMCGVFLYDPKPNAQP